MGKSLELAIGVLNGAVGDYLARTGNGLATEMTLVSGGTPIAPGALAATLTPVPRRLVVLVHGLMCTESVWDMPDGGADYGQTLAAATDGAAVYVRYNSGLAIPDNGAALSALLGEIDEAWPAPLEELIPVGYSMGGLVIRSATHVAATRGAGWLAKVRRAFYVGTPHLGAPLERLGRVATRILRAIPDPVVRLVAEVADLRSEGIQDLGDGDVRHEDRARRRPTLGLRDARHPVPLLPRIDHHLVAGTLSLDPAIAALFGDSVVPLPSGTFGRCEDARGLAFPADRLLVRPGVDHLTLAHDRQVAAQLAAWATGAAESAR